MSWPGFLLTCLHVVGRAVAEVCQMVLAGSRRALLIGNITMLMQRCGICPGVCDGNPRFLAETFARCQQPASSVTGIAYSYQQMVMVVELLPCRQVTICL